MASDAFVVGKDWISEHYFNTESTKQSFQARVSALRKEWDSHEDAGESTPRSRLAAVRAELLSALAHEGLDEHRASSDERDTATAQVEQRLVVETTDGGAVGAPHVVGEDPQPRSGVSLGVRAEQQVAARLVGVRTRRARPDDDLAAERLPTVVVGDATEALPARARSAPWPRPVARLGQFRGSQAAS